MKIGAAFGSYLKKEHIGDRKVRVVIRDVVVEEIKDDSGHSERKPVLYFEGKDMGLILNRTNADTLTSILGSDETDQWVGRAVGLYVDPSVQYAGKRIGGIRIANVAGPAPAPPPPPKADDFADDFQAADEDVPF